MHNRIGPEGPVYCSKCDGINIVNPVNEDEVLLRCLGCGHEKRKPPEPDLSWSMPEMPKRNEF